MPDTAKHHGRRSVTQRRNPRASLSGLSLEMLESRQLLSGSPQLLAFPELSIQPQALSSSIDGYTPAQIRTAYGFNSVKLGAARVPGDGSGQTIAIIDAFDDPNILSDLKTFDKQFSLSDPPTFTKVSQTGSTTALPKVDAGWAQETALDVEWAHAIAPKANILLVETKSENLSDLVAGVDYARKAPGVSVVSMSWGLSEFSNESSYDSHFTTPAGHTGVTFVAASGDDGAGTGATWPAISTNVLAVGGTTLTLNSSSGAYVSETAWRDSSGGTSRFEPAAGYESTVTTGTRRVAPDVSYDANPNTGVAIYDSLSYQGDVGWQVFGGTSAGAPQWAALVAIADQGRVLAGGKTLDGATGTLPALYALYSNTGAYSADFHDITSGGGGGGFGRRFHSSAQAQPGYDIVTGLGTPQAPHAIGALLNAKGGTAAKTKVVTSTKTAKTAKAALAKPASAVAAIPFQAVSDVVRHLNGLNVDALALLLESHTSAVAANAAEASLGVVKTVSSFAVSDETPSATQAPTDGIASNKVLKLIQPQQSLGEIQISIVQGRIDLWKIIPQFQLPLISAANVGSHRALLAPSSWWKQFAAFFASAAVGAVVFYGRRRGNRRTAPTKQFSLYNF